MKRSDLFWHREFLGVAEKVASWSKDPSTKIGAVIVNPVNRKIVSTGYNGFPRGVADLPERYENRELKYKVIVHAELNAIIHAGHEAKGCDIYTFPTIMVPSCCSECAKAIIQSGIKRVFFYKNFNVAERWKESADIATVMLVEANVEFIGIDRSEVVYLNQKVINDN